MIDYTYPGRRPSPGGGLDAALRAAETHADRLTGPSADDSNPVHTLAAWSDTIRAVAEACAGYAARREMPSLAETEALEQWLLRANACLTPWRRLLREVRHLAEPPFSEDEMRDLYLDVLGATHLVHEQADRWRSALASRRGGIPQAQVAERFIRGRTAHQDLARRALRVLPEGDARRDAWMYLYVFLTQRLTEYGGDSPGEAEGSRDMARVLAHPGSRLDDEQRAQMRSVEAALATHINTGGDAARATGAADLVRLHRNVWHAAENDPLMAARYGAELLRALAVGESVDGLGPQDAVEALETAVRTMDPDAPEWPETLAARALARTYAIGSFTAPDRRIDALVHELDAVRGLLPPGHYLMAPLIIALAQLLSLRGTGDGTLGDIRSALTLLRRARAEHVPEPVERLILDVVFAQVHIAFHYHAGADDADCTGTSDDSPPAADRAEHTAHTHRLLHRCVARAHELSAARQDHSSENLTMVMHTLGWSLMMAAGYPDGPGAGAHRGDARFVLVAEARAVLQEAVDRTDPRSPQRALREVLLHLAGFVEAQRGPGDATAARTHAAALARLAERADVVARPDLRSLHAYAESLLAAGAGAPVSIDRASRLRQLEASVAADPHAVDASAVNLRMHLARAYRPGGGTLSGFEELLVRAMGTGAFSGPAQGASANAERRRSRALGQEALGLLARRALVQEVAADAVLTADRAGPLSREVAAWCVADGALEEAVQALECGRALALHTEMATVDVRRQLTGLGRGDLADQWLAWRNAAVQPDTGRSGSVSDSGARTKDGTPDAWDSYVEHPLPERLGVQVRAVLEEHGAMDGLLGAVPVAEIATALRATGNDELVHLLPAQGPAVSGGALRVSRDGRVRWTALPRLAHAEPLDSYLSALELSLSAPRSEAVEQAWQARLGELCDWAGQAVVNPLLRELGPGSYPGRAPRLVLVPLGELAAVPWSAALLPGRPRRAIDRLVLSTIPSARMFTAAARQPAVQAGDSALLVLGLTGEQARVSSSRVLHRLYPDARLLAPGTGRPSGRPGRQPDNTTQPAVVLEELRRACAHGIVDFSAHLLPDPSDSWRSHLAFGTASLPNGTVGQDVDRLSVQAIAAQQFPVPSGGPGLCVSLASCMNSLPRRHHDESFTMAAAFLAGGASSVLGSLWQVRLHATALVDVLFHHGLRMGERPVDALRRAQLWMTDPERDLPGDLPPDAHRRAGELLEALVATGHDPADPALWAGLVLVGR